MLRLRSVNNLTSMLQRSDQIRRPHLVRCSSSVLERAQRFKPGDHVHGFTVNKVVTIPELYLTAVNLDHDNTGAEYLHIARDDANNVFSVNFRTTPMDNTGVPHILEHTVLCGSEKYPVRDPFFKMLTRSLSTFLNAMTANDYTMYPFATQNAKDFENLLSVYLDAVFFPKLTQFDFSQEGWRLEHEDVTDPTSPVIFKGVVFNEMKGALTNPDQLFSLHLQNNILPSHTYSMNSGGEPLNIPELTWEKLKEFHATHYHPSNSRFYTYGDIEMERHLELINNQALTRFSRIEPDTQVPKEKRWKQPKEKHVHCAVEHMTADPNKQTTLSVSFLLGDVTDTFNSFTASIFGSLLTAGPTSPFYQALIDANIGADYSPVVGYDNSTRDTTFTVGLKGIAEEDVEKVKQIIEETFDKVIEEGFADERIQAILHKIELGLKHQTTQFGLGLISSLMPSWNHGADPINQLQVNQNVEKFKRILEKNPNFLKEKVREYFKDNLHKLTLTMSPDEEYEQKKSKEEKKMLGKMLGSLGNEQMTDIYNNGIELSKLQSTSQDLSCLPSLEISDIEPEMKRTHVEHSTLESAPIQLCEQPTNGVTYFRAVSNMHKLPRELVPYVPLFCRVITKIGAGVMSHHNLAHEEELKTGGLGVGLHTSLHPSHMNIHDEGVIFSSHCLDQNLKPMFYLWTEIFNRAHLSDKKRLRTLIQMEAADLANSVADNGHHYALLCAGSSLTSMGQVNELFNGMTQVSMMKTVAEMKHLTPMVKTLQLIAKKLFNTKYLRCSLTTSPETQERAMLRLEKFLKTVPAPIKAEKGSQVKKIENPHFDPTKRRIHFPLPFPVNYTGRCIATVPYTDPDCATLRVLAKLMTSKFLHREIREKGGAYGGGASMSTSGLFSFYSYRDPNSVETFKTYEASAEWAANGHFTQQDINEAKLAVFQSVDYPIAPPNRGMLLFLHGITDDMKQTHREQIMNVTKEDLIEVANIYLVTGSRTDGKALLGPENVVTANKKDWLRVIDGSPGYVYTNIEHE